MSHLAKMCKVRKRLSRPPLDPVTITMGFHNRQCLSSSYSSSPLCVFVLYLIVSLVIPSLVTSYHQSSSTASTTSHLVQTLSSESITLSPRTVTTKYGSLKGNLVKLSSLLSRRTAQPSSSSSSSSSSPIELPDIEAYLGVPYATPPTGGLRFMPPVTPTHWRGIRLANKPTPVCPQRIPEANLAAMRSQNESEILKRMTRTRFEYLRRLIPMLGNQSEDCLYLNIYVPLVSPAPATGRNSGTNSWSGNSQSSGASSSSSSASSSSQLPVIVFLHGESYDWSSGNVFDGSVLAGYGQVLLVTLNYRLGIFGFLPAFVDGSVRGNYGLMDQVAALHWIQENIAEFGGAPSNVTIIGHGHGAACAHLLMLSPMAKGLFNRVVLMSGSALSPWAIVRDPEYYSRLLGQKLNCTNLETMIDCLRNRKVTELTNVQLPVPDHLTAFGPIIDSIVVPLNPRRLYHTELYRQFDAAKSRSWVSTSNLSALGSLIEQSLGRSYDLLLGVTDVDAPCVVSEDELKKGMQPSRRDRIMRTLVQNLYDYHQQSIFLALYNEYSDWSEPTESSQEVLNSAVSFLADSLNVVPLVQTADLHATNIPGTTSRIQSGSRRLTDGAFTSRTFFYTFDVNAANQANFDIPSRFHAHAYDEKVNLAPPQTPLLVCSSGHDLAYLFGDPIVQAQLGSSNSGSSNLGPFYFGFNLTRAHATISELFIQYMVNFVRSGDPNNRSSHFSTSNPNLSNRQSQSSSSSTSSSSPLQVRAFWPLYETKHKTYLSLGSLSPKAYDHEYNHRLSLWLNLIPRLLMDDREYYLQNLLNLTNNSSSHHNRPLKQMIDFALINAQQRSLNGGATSETLRQRASSSTSPAEANSLPYSQQQQHLLLDHENPKSFDGIVRNPEMIFRSQNMNQPSGSSTKSSKESITTSTNGSLVNHNSTGSNLPSIQIQTQPPNQQDKVLQNNSENNVNHDRVPTPPGGNSFDLFRSTFITSGDGHHTNTAMIITIGIGSALLLFNVVIFVALYYQLDKNRKLVAAQQTQINESNKNNNSESKDPQDKDNHKDLVPNSVHMTPTRKYRDQIPGPPPPPPNHLQLEYTNQPDELLVIGGSNSDGTLSRKNNNINNNNLNSNSYGMYQMDQGTLNRSTLRKQQGPNGQKSMGGVMNPSAGYPNDTTTLDGASWNSATINRVTTIDHGGFIEDRHNPVHHQSYVPFITSSTNAVTSAGNQTQYFCLLPNGVATPGGGTVVEHQDGGPPQFTQIVSASGATTISQNGPPHGSQSTYHEMTV